MYILSALIVCIISGVASLTGRWMVTQAAGAASYLLAELDIWAVFGLLESL